MPVAASQQQNSIQRSPEPPIDTCAAQDCYEHGHSVRRTAVLFFLCLIPFWSIPLAHVISQPETATGFFNYELPYYVANGRAAFDRGNGVTYPNPYLADEEAPAIYAHWLLWLMGVATAVVGVDPGDLILIATLSASVLFAWTTWQLVGVRVRGVARRRAAFAGAMLGGGLLAGGGLYSALLGGGSLLQFDPGKGLWFLNWGRNCLFPTEAVYHAVVASCWLSEIRGRQRAANFFLVLLATTHPWSGIELLLTVNLFRGVVWLRQRDRANLTQVALSASVLVAFLVYYKIWLPTFPTHASLQQVWNLNWRVEYLTALLAWGPVAVAALVYVRTCAARMSRADRFLLCTFVVAFSLSMHDRLINPVQPLHFTRGYVWMPLFLLGLPVWMAWGRGVLQKTQGWAQTGKLVIAATLLLLIVSDNLVFAAVHFQRQVQQADGFHLTSDERSLFAALGRPECAGRVTLTESEKINYLLPTWVAVRPWVGHQFNTPDYAERMHVWSACFQQERVDADSVPADVTQIVVRSDTDSQCLQAEWMQVPAGNARWKIWHRQPTSDRDE